ncbi:hypothetical protein PNOK_0587200 [Pyrrhoderma noxium]|uniref:DUF4336 domain-containing protein n=1 Tax=Pyrrhoderma noxium TaxID=2282107 RepID=A0A286UHK8_9AGAM|nr:hypothetical protein PNOK_0587200 [Pyrrhoderma noxium]
MSETVIREVTKDVWTFSKPFVLRGVMPIGIPVGGRSTAIKLANGDLWVVVSTPLDTETRAKIDELGGQVKYIVGINAVHNLYLSEFKKAFPEAKLIGVSGHLSKLHLKELNFDGVYGKDPADTKYGFEEEIKACHFSGHKNHDTAFLHVASGTLIEADLIFNFPCNEQFSKSKQSGRIPIITSFMTRHSLFHRKFVWGASLDKEAMKRDVTTVSGWEFDRIIPCHGDVIENGGKSVWAEAFKQIISA